MSSAALTVSPRHLALPECALFAPCELSISAACTQDEFRRIGQAIAALESADSLWVADLALYAHERWKDEGLKLAAASTKRSKFFLYKASFVAKRFPPSKRYPNYKYSHYREMLPFPEEFTDKFLAENADKNLPCKALRALAVAAFGEEPYKNKQPKKQSVSIRAELYARLRPFSESRKVCLLVERICEDWLKQRPEAPNQPVGSAEAAGNESAATQPCPNPETPRPVEVDLSEPEAQTGRGGPKEYLDAEDGIHRLTDRPTYDQRRAQQIADGAQPIKKKGRKPRNVLRLQWVPCVPKAATSESGAHSLKQFGSQKPTCFPTEADAIAAEEKYFLEHGHHEEVVYCVVPCGAYHVKHIYSSEVPQNKSAQAEA